MAAGTAPRRVSPGVWRTRTGRTLTPDGGAYWENLYRTGHTDGKGHMRTPSVVQTQPKPGRIPLAPGPKATQKTPPPRKPGFKDLVFGTHPERQRLYERHQQAGRQARAQVQQMTDARFGNVIPLARRANPVINPAVGNVLTAISPLTAAEQTLTALQHHRPLAAGIAAMGIIPFGPGKGVKLVKAGEKAVEGEKALTAGEQVYEASQKAKRLLPAQRALQRAERGRRAALLAGEHEAAGGGQAGHYAQKAALKGELPTLTFDRLTHFDQATMDELHNAVRKLPKFGEYDKVALAEALDRMQAGRPPRLFEVKLIERAFGPQAAKEAESTIPLSQQILHGVEEVANIPRAIMASADVSAPFRQALMFAAHDPKTFAKNLAPMFHMLVSERKYKDVIGAIHADPMYDEMRQAGLKLTELGTLDKREEAFMSNLAEKITGLGPLVGKPVGTGSFVRASGRAYTGFLDALRVAGYKNFVEIGRDLGYAPAEMERLQRSAANFVNMATGRGNLRGLERSAVALNTVFFSPRLFASRVDAFNPVFYAQLDPLVRKKAMAATFKLVAAGSTILGLAALAGARIVTDPRNSDWGKVRIGNTRFDIWGGHQQIARLISQIATGEIVSSTTGETLRLTGGYSMSRQDIVKRFFEGKLAPTPSIVNDWFRGSDFAGKPFSWKKAMLQRSYPLIIQDAIDTARQQGSPWAGVAAYGIGSLGIGIQSYGPKATPGGTGPVWGSNRGGGGFTRPSEPAVWGGGNR